MGANGRNRMEQNEKELCVQIQNIQSMEKKSEFTSLWKNCFGDSEEYMAFYFHWKTKDNQVLFLYQKELIAMLHLNPYQIRLRNQEILLHYIVGVATKQRYRKQGCMRKLLEAAFHLLSKEPFVYLMPAKEEIYLPFGFRFIYETEQWQGKLPQGEILFAQSDIIIKNWDKSHERETQLLIDFTSAQLEKEKEIYAKRTVSYYERLQAEMQSEKGDICLLLTNQQIICGYFCYVQAQETIEIIECILDKKKTRMILAAMFSFIQKKKTGVKQIRFSQSDWLEESVCDTFGFQKQKRQVLMGRILHFQKFIQPFYTEKPLTLVLSIKDSILKQNEKTWRLQFDTTGCVAVETKEPTNWEIDIADLTSILFSKRTKTGAVEQKPELWNQLKKISRYQHLFLNEIV